MHGHVATLFLIATACISNAQLVLQRTLSGPTLLDEFNFDSNLTVDAGFTYVDPEKTQSRLAYVEDQDTVVLRVDDSLVPYNDLRQSVSMTSKQAWGLGSFIVLNITHMPWGCSLAPTFRTHSEMLSGGGAVTVFKRRNLQTDSTAVLSHMNGSCHLDSSFVAPTILGSSSITPDRTNCANGAPCEITYSPERDISTDGSMAGTYVLNLAEEAVSIWFFPANTTSIPVVLRDDIIWSTDTLGPPAARFAFAGDSCRLADVIAPQYLNIALPLCGESAADTGEFNDAEGSCTGRCYIDWVVGDGAPYKNASMSIASLRIYSNATLNSPSLATTTAPSPSDNPYKDPAPNPPRRVLPVVVAGSAIGMLLGIASWVAGSRLPVAVKPPRLRAPRGPTQ